jgi:hypothetical protein
MAAIFAFKCTSCGEIHEGSPSFGFKTPDQYACLSDEEKTVMGTLRGDFCTITDGAGTDYFVRGILEVPIIGVADPFLWGVWVSLSKKSFDRYSETFKAPVEGDGFFGWVSNDIAVYPNSALRPADVVVQLGNQRPKVVLHKNDLQPDQLAIDQAQGISIARAQELAELALHAA